VAREGGVNVTGNGSNRYRKGEKTVREADVKGTGRGSDQYGQQE